MPDAYWCWYHDNAYLGPPLLGIWLGVSHQVGSVMSYWLLTNTGSVVSITTVQRVTTLERQKSYVKTECDEFDTEISRRIKNDGFSLEGSKINPEDWAELVNHDSDFQEEFNRIFRSEDVPEAD